jgi:serine/threonine protein phosphatase PrpC
MLVNYRPPYRTPKEGESITDCQDDFEINQTKGCFAIADGASQSFYPAIWAKLLVQHFCENPEINKSNWETWLESIQAKWLTEVRDRVETAKSQGKPTWVESHNGLIMQRAATSTFIGLRFSEDRIRGCYVGDSCVFVIRNSNLELYTLKSSKDFSDRPEYFASYPKDNHFNPHFFDINFDQSDDVDIILATDALSEYILKCSEQKKEIFPLLLEISSQEQFECFVASARHQTIKMKNDDVTLLILRYDSSSPQKRIDHVRVTSDPPISPSNQPPAETPRITNSIEDSNGSNFLKPWVSVIVNKLSSFLTTSQDTERPIPNFNRSPSKIINHLKQQRAILVAMVIFLPLLSFWMGRVSSKLNQPATQSIANSNVVTRPTQLLKGSIIYADQDLRQPLIRLFNSSEVLILEEGNGWVKFQIELYAYNTIVNPYPNCSSTEIEIIPARNLRVFPSGSDIDIFGQLDRNTKFQRVEFNSLPGWYKLRFVGYIAK